MNEEPPDDASFISHRNKFGSDQSFSEQIGRRKKKEKKRAKKQHSSYTSSHDSQKISKKRRHKKKDKRVKNDSKYKVIDKSSEEDKRTRSRKGDSSGEVNRNRSRRSIRANQSTPSSDSGSEDRNRMNKKKSFYSSEDDKKSIKRKAQTSALSSASESEEKKRSSRKIKSKRHLLSESGEQDLKRIKKTSSSEEEESEKKDFVATESEKILEFLDHEGTQISHDAEILLRHYVKSFEKVSSNLQRPNVLITGITGVGKSSLINKIFGRKIARTGAGTPITQHFSKYDLENRIIIFDSKGLEHGFYEEFIETTEEFFNEHQIGETGESSNAIHVVWYVIDAAHGRFQPFEEKICRELFNHVPLIFLLNKADIVSREDKDRLRQVLINMDLPNCVGIFDVIACNEYKAREVTHCPSCNSEDIFINPKKCLMLCSECGYKEQVVQNDGLDDVIDFTCSVLPTFVRDAFISAQIVSFNAKKHSSSQVIVDFWNEFEHIRSINKYLRTITRAMARIGILWEFKEHGHLYGAQVAKILARCLSWKDKMKLAMKKGDKQRIHAVALLILWNKSLATLSHQIFTEWKEQPNNQTDINNICQNAYSKAFSLFNEDILRELEERLSEVDDVNQVMKEFD